MIRKTGGTKTTWGTEIVWASTDKYCAKLLMFTESGSKTAVQFHKERSKTWFVNEGTFVVRWVDTDKGLAKETIIKQGEVVEVPALRPYQLESLLPNGVIFESGTAEVENDTFRLSPEETVETQS